MKSTDFLQYFRNEFENDSDSQNENCFFLKVRGFTVRKSERAEFSDIGPDRLQHVYNAPQNSSTVMI